MMSALNSTLRSIIFGKKEFCCLCLCPNQEETVNIDDEITVNLNNNEHNMDVSHVLSSVLGEAAYKYITAFDTFCELCIKSAINCYRFIQTSRNNVEYLSNILDGIANSFTYITDEVYNSRSLFVSLNLDDFTSKQVYDTTRKVLTPQAALRRFCSLDVEQISNNELDLKIKKEDTHHKSKEVRHSTFNKIPTSNMLFNKNNPNIIQCKECLKVYPEVCNLRKHYDKVHAPKIFKCSECSNTYGSASNLHAHEIENHTHSICSECGKTFSCRSTLRMHEVGHHLSIVCQDCGRVYKNKVTFKNHIDLNICGRETRAHPSEAQYTCDYCNKKYTQKVSLRVHIQYDHGNYKGHTCKWCGKKFWAPSRLKAHIVKHTREKNFVCSFCGGKFVSKESLLYHTRRHTGEKPYKCPHCDGRFLSASRRSVHIKSQHQKATYECDVCHRKFHSESYLQKHKQRHFESSYTDKSKNLSENMSTDDLKPINVEVQKNWNGNIASEPTLFKTTEVARSNLKHVNIESPEDKVYLEVSDNAEDYINTTIS